jgi:ABC-type glycerol-3-phosphate transport system substrate-binding protein
VPHGVTWEEFIDMQKKIKENTDVAPFALDMGASSMRTDWTLRVLQDVLLDDKLGAIKGIEGYVERTWKPGEPITMEETVRAIKKGVYSAKDPAWQEQLRLLKEWSQYFEKGFLAGPDVYRLYITGKAAMTWDGSWSIKPIDVDPLREFEYGIFPHFPKITSETSPYVKRDILPPAMAGVGGVFQYAVAAESEKRGVLNESVDWMMYITAPQNIVPLLNDQTSFAPGIKNPENVDPRLGVFVDMMVEAGVERLEPYDSMLTRDFFDKFYKLVQQYVGGKLDMEQVTDEIQKEMEIAADLIIKEHPEWEAENW